MIQFNVTLSPRQTHSGRGRCVVALAVAAAMLPVLALASPVDLPNTFESGAPVLASEFNDNFEAAADAIDDNDTRISALEGSSDGGVPSAAVVFFDATECPAGWTELTEARGRAVVGMGGSAGTLLGTVGGAFEDLEDRAHSHTTDIGNVTSTSVSVAHTHGVAAHSTGSAGSHNHQWKDGQLGTFSAAGGAVTVPAVPLSIGAGITAANWGSADRFTDNDGAHSHSVASQTTGAASSTGHTHVVNPPATASSSASTGAVMPYVQLLACRRD